MTAMVMGLVIVLTVALHRPNNKTSAMSVWALLAFGVLLFAIGLVSYTVRYK